MAIPFTQKNDLNKVHQKEDSAKKAKSPASQARKPAD